MTIVSPDFGLHISSKPKYAVLLLTRKKEKRKGKKEEKRERERERERERISCK